ncbi:hypothetical protein V6N13_026041 [Hibiscus sabdariffa]
MPTLTLTLGLFLKDMKARDKEKNGDFVEIQWKFQSFKLVDKKPSRDVFGPNWGIFFYSSNLHLVEGKFARYFWAQLLSVWEDVMLIRNLRGGRQEELLNLLLKYSTSRETKMLDSKLAMKYSRRLQRKVVKNGIPCLMRRKEHFLKRKPLQQKMKQQQKY